MNNVYTFTHKGVEITIDGNALVEVDGRGVRVTVRPPEDQWVALPNGQASVNPWRGFVPELPRPAEGD